jgi:hypothetical protein
MYLIDLPVAGYIRIAVQHTAYRTFDRDVPA